jgi:siderophore synthetase component
VIVDKNDSHKGIYFKTYEEAENIRIVFSQRYIFSGNLLNLIAIFNKDYLDETA